MVNVSLPFQLADISLSGRLSSVVSLSDGCSSIYVFTFWPVVLDTCISEVVHVYY